MKKKIKNKFKIKLRIIYRKKKLPHYIHQHQCLNIIKDQLIHICYLLLIDEVDKTKIKIKLIR